MKARIFSLASHCYDYPSSCSGGGYHSIAGADRFKAYGVKPVKVLAGSAPIKIRSWTPMGFIRSYFIDKDLAPFDAINVGLVALAFSDTRPGIPN